MNNKTLVYLKENGNFVFEVTKGFAPHKYVECTSKGEFVSEVSLKKDYLDWIEMFMDFEDLKLLAKFPLDGTTPEWKYIDSIQVCKNDESIITWLDIFGTTWGGSLRLCGVYSYRKSLFVTTLSINELNPTPVNAKSIWIAIKNADFQYYTDNNFEYLEEISMCLEFKDINKLTFLDYESVKVKPAVDNKWWKEFEDKLKKIFDWVNYPF